MDKSEIGAHLNGLPPATARGLHNLFNKLLDEIHALRQAAHWHASDAEIVSLDPVQEAEPPVDLDPVAAPAANAPIAATEDGTIIESAAAPADVPPAA